VRGDSRDARVAEDPVTARRDPAWLAAAIFITIAGCALAWLVALVTLPLGPALLAPLVLAASGLCAITCVWLSPYPLTWRAAMAPVVMGLLAGLAPTAVVLAIRLSVTTCTVINLFGLPWAEPWRSIMHVASICVCILSCIVVFRGLTLDRGLRRSAIAMVVWSIIATGPAFVLFFITFYGDPAAGCVPT
jgi:hypothetical protein